MRLPLGQDNFKKIIDSNLDFIDKTLLIKDVFEDVADIILITRPRRFGKTLNLSMLQYFLAAEAYGASTKGLFDKFKIAQHPEYMQRQGKFPVIFVSFKDIKDHEFKHVYATLCRLVSEVYSEHKYLLDSPKLDAEDKKLFLAIARCEITKDILEGSLKNLCKYLYNHFGEKPWLLIDEYDTPIQSSYLNGFYSEMISLMRNLFGAALKTNPYIYKAVITGVLRISKESIFSELNNIKVYSVLSNQYSQYFGFTEQEMDYILRESNLMDKAKEIKSWYNGYQFGNTIVYNPWSIVNLVHEKGELSPYWVNTSSNDLVKQMIIRSSIEFKKSFEDLLQGIPIQTIIDEHVVFGDLDGSESAVWSLLLAAGYLKVTASEKTDRGELATLSIPNREVRSLYRRMIEGWLANKRDFIWYDRFLSYLLTGEIEEFAENLKDVMLQIVSVHDLAKEPEAFYHGLMLGLAASLDKDKYELKSNRESGRGRYDIIILPKDPQNKAVIMEFKNIKCEEGEKCTTAMLEQKAEEALMQIDNLEYLSEIKQRGIATTVKIGLAFSGKEFRVRFSEVVA